MVDLARPPCYAVAHPPRPEAQLDSSSGQHIERGRHLVQDDRVAKVVGQHQ